MNGDFDAHAGIQDYYGKVLKSSADLQTSACCTADAMPGHLFPLFREVHDEVKDRFYGCGSPIPPALDAITVLDRYPHAFDLDDHHHFVTGKPMLVCGNTADMLNSTRSTPHFRVSGEKKTHYGLFDCGPGKVAQTSEARAKSCQLVFNAV